ncbi:MAG: phytanoyl-CoA dioxygenase family protein [Planctomycetota bacterium]
MSLASTAPPPSAPVSDRAAVTVEQYRDYRCDGFVIVRGLVPDADVAELRRHTEDLMQGRLPEQRDLPALDPEEAERQATENRRARGEARTKRELFRPDDALPPEEKAKQFLRIHMLHRQLALHERYLLHPRVLDVVEVLTGPDVMALQTMLFLKPPGSQGQGWHQDSFYIPTSPDSLIGAWLAIDDADEYNGGLWFAKGSGAEPVHPPCPDTQAYGFGDRLVSDVPHIKRASDPDDTANMLTPVADRYDQVLGSVEAGDVVFFNGHVLHRSKANATADRFRRAFVAHYANARAFTAWGRDEDNPQGQDLSTGMTNGSHILARGDTHLPFAKPRFGTPCAATLPPDQRAAQNRDTVRRIAAANHGLMGCAIDNPEQLVDHD